MYSVKINDFYHKQSSEVSVVIQGSWARNKGQIITCCQYLSIKKNKDSLQQKKKMYWFTKAELKNIWNKNYCINYHQSWIFPMFFYHEMYVKQ